MSSWTKTPGMLFLRPPLNSNSSVTLPSVSEQDLVTFAALHKDAKVLLLDYPLDVKIQDTHQVALWDKAVRGNCWALASSVAYAGQCKFPDRPKAEKEGSQQMG